MPSLTASFVDVLDQSVNFTHLCARHYVVNVLVPALAKLAAQLVADLLIAAGLVGEPLRVGSVYFFVHMLTPSTSLILKHVVGSASGAHGATTGKAARAAARAAVCAALHCEAVQRGLFALARGNIHADPRSTRSLTSECATAAPRRRSLLSAWLRFSFVARANNWDLGPAPTYPAHLGAPSISWVKRDSLLMARFTPKAVLCGYVPIQCLEHGERP